MAESVPVAKNGHGRAAGVSRQLAPSPLCSGRSARTKSPWQTRLSPSPGPHLGRSNVACVKWDVLLLVVLKAKPQKSCPQTATHPVAPANRS